MENTNQSLPNLLNAQDVQNCFRLSRSMVYKLLNDPACGVVQIGHRKFFHRDIFLHWLEEQATKKGE